jgi:hypothetical protein
MELLVQSDTRPSKVYPRIEEFLRGMKVRERDGALQLRLGFSALFES